MFARQHPRAILSVVRQAVVTTGLTLLQQTLLERKASAARHPFASFRFPSWHCTVLVCQPVSQVREQVKPGPVTHCSCGVASPTCAALAGDRVCFWSGLLGSRRSCSGHQGLSWGLWQNLHNENFLGGQWPSRAEVVPMAPTAVVHAVPLMSMMVSEVEIMYLPLIRYSHVFLLQG